MIFRISSIDSGTATSFLRFGVLLTFFSSFIFAAEIDDALQITLNSDKSTYSLGETISFRLTIKSTSQEAVKVLLRGFSWEDLTRMDEQYMQTQSRAKYDKQWAKLAERPNLADKLRAEGSPRPLGTLELLPDVASGTPRRHGFGVDSMACGTGLNNGLMPANAECSHAFTVGPNACWGQPGTYRFQWRAYRPQARDRCRIDLSNAVSNVVQIVIEK